MAEHEPEGPRRSVMIIPRIVTQFWEHGSPPECALAVMRENQRANPNWRFALLKADDIELSLLPAVEGAILNMNISKAYRCLHAAYPQARSDFVRYAALFVSGGIWMDVKSSAREPLDRAFGALGGGMAHFSEQAASPRPHTLLTWACAGAAPQSNAPPLLCHLRGPSNCLTVCRSARADSSAWPSCIAGYPKHHGSRNPRCQG